MGERFSELTGLKMTHVPYKGGGTLIADLAGGQLDMAFFAMAGPVPAMVKQGRIKVLGVSHPAPSPLFADAPPLSRHPMLQGFRYDTWIGLQVPRRTPDAAVRQSQSPSKPLPDQARMPTKTSQNVANLSGGLSGGRKEKGP